MENLDIAAITTNIVIPWGTRLVLALAIFFIGRMAVGAVAGLVRKLLNSRGVDDILVGFLVAILRWVLLLFVIIAALSQLGINTNSLVAVLGAAGLGHRPVAAKLPVELCRGGHADHLPPLP